MYTGIQFCCQSNISNVHLMTSYIKNSNKKFTICHMAQLTQHMTSRFKWSQQRKNFTSAAYYLHIQREQTICQKRTEQKIATKRKQIVYSVIPIDLLTGYTHTLQFSWREVQIQENCRVISRLRYLTVNNNRKQQQENPDRK